MRDDFAKLLVLTGRVGGGETFRIHRAVAKQHNFENAPSKQGMRRPYRERKQFDEYLNPLKRFLYKQVNRPWDKVYSELMQSLHGGNTIMQHVKQHLFSYVELKIEYVNNVPYYRSPYYGLRLMQAGTMYVDKQGILRKARKTKEKIKHKDNARVMINPLEDYIKINNVWYHVWFAVLPEAEQCNVGLSCEDVFMGKMTVTKYSDTYIRWTSVVYWRLDEYGLVPSGNYAGRKRYAYKKKQIDVREIREEKLNS
jgi:hypothetical protein